MKPMIEQALQSFLNLYKEAILVRDSRGAVQLGNLAARELYGERWGTVASRKAEWKRIVEQSHQIRQEFTAKVKRRNALGYSVAMHLKVLPLWDEAGIFSGIIERSNTSVLQEEPVRPQPLALAMAVAHDLRSPLSILQNLALLMESRFEARHIEMMQKQLLFCEAIVNNFLEYAGGRGPRKVAVSLEEILGEVVSEIPVPEEIIFDIDSFEGIMIEGDPGQIRHVVMNLVQNAVESMAGKSGAVRIGITTSQDEMMCLRITDSGPGIEPQDLSRVFQPFYTTKLRGFGLGLAACKQIVDAHGGKMEVQSSPGNGTTFTVYLPLAG